ncbi:MAG: Crp/Fnr family transcriptional regulator [Gallionellaceae bacterium]|nr:Crp/Fnr family transcriptional regulator [Gallionellaceae bacterium]
MLALHNPIQNRLLAALPKAELERIEPALELVTMKLGEVLCESGGKIQYVYFPTTSIVSIHYVMENGASAESAGVGNEGMVGVPLITGGDTMPSLAVVQTAGQGYRLKAQVMRDALTRAGGRRNGKMQYVLLRYAQALMTQMSQMAACNRHHTVDQQLCRWLLLTLDRLSSNELTMTQELIASMLGVRREGITEAAGKLQQAGYIRYRRGHITVLDRAGLQANVCECYEVVKKEYDRLLGNPTQPATISAVTEKNLRRKAGSGNGLYSSNL